MADGRYCVTDMDEIVNGKAVFIGNEIKKQKKLKVVAGVEFEMKRYLLNTNSKKFMT